MPRFVKSLSLLAVLVFVGLITFGATAFAQSQVVADQSSIVDVVRPLLDAFSGGHYAYAASLLVVLMVALAKRYAGDRYPWLHTDAGGSAMALLAASAGAVVAAGPTAAITWGLWKTALLIGVGAAGGFAVVKNLFIEPILQPLAARIPARLQPWTQPLFAAVLWIFEHDRNEAPATPTPASPPAPAPSTPAQATEKL